MEENKIMSHYQKGLLISLIVIVIGVAGYMMGLAEKTWFQWIGNISLFAGIIWSVIYYGNQKEGYVTFGNLFSHGFKTTAIAALVLTAYTFLAFTVLFPEMKETLIDRSIEQIESRNNMTDEQIENAINITRRFFMPFAIGGTLIGTLIFGCIASLIGAAVTKKNPVNPMDQMN